MRRIVSITVFLLVLLFSFSTASAIEIEQIFKKIDPDKTTESYRKSFWKDMKGKQVTWTGKLYEVRGGFHDVYKVFVRVGSPPLGNYNVIMTVSDQPKVDQLKRGSIIRFRGTLRKYKWSNPRPVRQPDGSMKYIRRFVIYLEDGHIGPGSRD